MDTTDLTAEQVADANTLIQTITQRPSQKHISTGVVNIGGQEDIYRPIIEALREEGHVILVGTRHENPENATIERWVSSGQKESKLASNTNW